MKKLITASLAVALLVFTFNTISFAADPIRFGVPPWPGVEVKTEIASQILNTLGYPTEQLQIGPPIIYNGFASDEVDAFLGGWVPQQDPLLNPLLEKGLVEVAQTNLDEAVISLCVPKYVAAEGVKSFADLDAHADKFKHNIYNIETGSPMHSAMEEIIKTDVAGLGDWEQTSTTTPIMLQEVSSEMNEQHWVVFACWKPHWMNLMLEMSYLEPVPGTEKFASNSKVYTVVSAKLKTTHPNVYRFLKQLTVTAQTQSGWIMDYARKKIPEDQVAKKWISENKEAVEKWLEGVKAADGSSAIDKIKQAY